MQKLMRKIFLKPKRFKEDKSGAVAIEFSIVAIPFIGLVFASFEVGWFYYVNAAIDSVTLEAARQIRTGSPQQGGLDKQDFYNEVCPKLEIFGECEDILTVEVQKFADFNEFSSDTTPATCADDDQDSIDDIVYEPGQDNEIVRLRICLIYKTFNFALGTKIAETAEGKKRLTSSYVFRNEPFSRNQPST